jgi:Xaa-Pro aminopeptidase
MIILKNRQEIEKIRVASRYAMEILLSLGEFVREGIKSIELACLQGV